ncbi:ECF-type sigma factor [Engelhardtia mirabilis]|uniref:RNA polymerase sigma factor n=1 Tax=Engelhardtia mirabilis TaxID=2528011 RepID=A0A518BS07_9BACT|nr:RNA polymerase sigma factor [Planctomycetes bacterium Pla133]QDV04081.1 RNA polymerase sigma factor [Planctomycetes bacterium Pla86]
MDRPDTAPAPSERRRPSLSVDRALVEAQPPGKVNELLPLVYERLRDIARRFVDSPGRSTLQPTALVHEAYVKLVRAEPDRDFDQEHFLCLAARAMRQILVDHARERGAAKRGGGWNRISLNLGSGAPDSVVPAVELAEALSRLEKLDERQVRIAELRAFGGMTVPEISRALGIPPRTVDAQWRIARAWLQAELSTES